MAQVTFIFDTETESQKIKLINEVLFGQNATTATTAAEAAPSPKPKQAAMRAPKETTAPSESDTQATESSAKSSSSSKVTFDEFKAAAKKAKTDHGEDFVMEVLLAAGTEKQSTLLKTVQEADKELYANIIEAWAEGPQAKAEPEAEAKADDLDDGLGDDGLGDEAEEAEVSADAVKLALKAYAKEKSRDEAKAIMNNNGAKTLTDVEKCSQKQLAAMMKELV